MATGKLDQWVPPNLKGRVAVVAGASRGAGRGIAAVLGQSRATVYVTGRSSDAVGGSRRFPWTIDQTAAEVTARGGDGIAVLCDHTDPAQVERLFRRVAKEEKKLDLLVNNVWGGYERNERGLPPGPFWKQPIWNWDAMFEAGLKAHFLSTYSALPLMLRKRRGLIVNTIAWDRGKYLLNLYYDVAKQAIRRMAYGLSLELRKYGIAALALAPGWMRTELVLEAHRKTPFDLRRTESTEYLGRAVASLAADSKVLEKSGQVLTVGLLAKEYGFTDIDGRQIPAFRIPPKFAAD
jgi:NAD(P)-dependent dehydrogenase (short-subunit alcohol dehydrogenase family)